MGFRVWGFGFRGSGLGHRGKPVLVLQRDVQRSDGFKPRRRLLPLLPQILRIPAFRGLGFRV